MKDSRKKKKNSNKGEGYLKRNCSSLNAFIVDRIISKRNAYITGNVTKEERTTRMILEYQKRSTHKK